MSETPDTPSTEALTPDPSDCPQCGDGRDSPRSDCANCGFIQPAPCGDPSGRCLYVGPHEGDHKVAPVTRAVRQEAADTSGLREARLALEFVADWAHDSADGDTLYGFAAVETMTRDALAALEGATERPLDALAPCRTCGNLRDTPMHELGCAAGRIVAMFDGNPMIEPTSEFGEAVANLRDVLASPTTTTPETEG